jgi:hypothetical protein
MLKRAFSGFVLVFFALNSCCKAQENPAPPASLEAALGIQQSLEQLSKLNQQGEGSSSAAISLRQDVLE